MMMKLLFFCILISSCLALPSRDDIYGVAISLFESNNYQEFFSLLEEAESAYGNLIKVGNGRSPSLYAYRGVAAYNSQNMTLAESSLSKSVQFNPVDTRSWINLGEVRVQTFSFKGAIEAFERAYALGDYSALPHLLRVKGWINNWQDFESLSSTVEKNFRKCYDSYCNSSSDVYRATKEERSLILKKGNPACLGLDSSTGFEYTYLPGQVQKIGHIRSPNALDRHKMLPSQHIASLWNYSDSDEKKAKERRRLKVGIVSADFGVHPVSTLIRGTLQQINTSRIELYCFSIKQSMSWWGINISSTVEHFYYLPQIDTYDAARAIAALKIEVLIDLNGHTQHSGLRLMGHRPAPLQISYLGLPTTTGATFIDYYLGDSVALPPEHRSHFSESISYLPHCYIANDYAQTQGDIVEYYSRSSMRASRTTFADQVLSKGSTGLLVSDTNSVKSRDTLSRQFTQASLFLATFSNTQKMDPVQFQVWMNIMRGIPGSMMLHIKHHGSVDSWPYLLNNAAYFGIQSNQMVLTAQTPWIEHIYRKTSLDLILDTSVKNGHTTGLDGLWAGVPTLSYGNGRVMIERAAESMQTSLGSTLGLAYSAKDYETSALRLSKYASEETKDGQRVVPPMDRQEYMEDKYASSISSRLSHLDELCLYNSTSFPSTAQYTRLLSWREDICKKRSSSRLFDSNHFSDNFMRQLEVTWDVIHVQDPNKPRYHIITGTHSDTAHYSSSSSSSSSDEKGDEEIPLDQVYSSQSEVYSVEQGTQRRGASITVADPSGEPAFIKSLSVPHTDKTEEAIHNVQNGKKQSSTSMKETEEYPAIPEEVWKQTYIFLNIGGIAAKQGWFNVNAQQHDIAHKDGTLLHGNIDIFRKMNDLHGFSDDSVSAIYASHILEHNRFGDQTLEKTLQEWKRVLRPGGLLMISVPDLTTVFQLYLSPTLELKDRWLLTKVIYGAQSDEYDYHYVGFDWSLLSIFLAQNGFCNIERVGSFNLFSDSSEIVLFNKSISLNVAARKCSETEGQQGDFTINHNADPYVPYEFPHGEICLQCQEKKGQEESSE